MIKFLRPVFVFSLLTSFALLPCSGASKSTKSSAGNSKTPRAIISKNPYLGAIVTDATTGKVVFEDQPDAKGYPASMLKLMDLLIVLEKVERKEISLQDQVPVSARAAKTTINTSSPLYHSVRRARTVMERVYSVDTGMNT